MNRIASHPPPLTERTPTACRRCLPEAVLLTALVISLHAHGTVICNTDFGTADQPIRHAAAEAADRLQGVVPAGWHDNSEWAEVWTTCRVEEEDGQRFLRCNVSRIDQGWFQLAGPRIPRTGADALYRLSARLRNRSGTPLTLGVRSTAKPYTMHWSTRAPCSDTWETHTFEFRLPSPPAQVGIYLLMQGTGILDLASVKLECLTRDDLVAEFRAAYPDGGPANLMRNSRFPLGLQSGWSIGREHSDGDDVTVTADPEVIGPSGAPSLRCLAAGSALLRFEPFGVVNPTVKHKAVLSVQGEGQWSFSLSAGQRRVGSHNVKLDDTWQRIAITFDPVLLAKVYQWRVQGAGKLWIDALQVGPATKVGDYASAGACEVALSCAGGAAVAARVQFEDEPAAVSWCVTGKATGATLKGCVYTPQGESRALPDTPVGSDFLTNGEFDYGVFPRHPFGSFRIEAWVEHDAKRISPVNELVVHRLRRPRYWGVDAPASPFGTHTLSTTRHILMAKAIGVNWTRFHDAGLEYIGWWNLEPEPGQWRFFDREIKRFRTHGMKIFAELGTAPRWASYYTGSGRKGFGYFDKFFQPRDLTQYAHYVDTVVRRYKGVIDAWDVWNEPWIHAWWGVDYDNTRGDRAGYLTSEHPQRDFTRLMQTAYEHVKAVDPDATVAGFNTTTGGGGDQAFSGSDWTRGVLANDGLQWSSVVDYHHYTTELAGPPQDVVARGLDHAVGPIREELGSVPRPLWMSEGNGITGTMGSGFYRHTIPYHDAENVVDTGNRLCRYVVSLLAHGVERVFLYSMHSHNYFSPTPAKWSVLVTQEGYLHPSGAAFSAMAWHLEDTRFVAYRHLADGVWAALFEDTAKGKERAVAVLVKDPGSPAFRVPALPGVMARDLFGNPLPADHALDENLVYLEASAGMEPFDKLPTTATGAADSDTEQKEQPR